MRALLSKSTCPEEKRHVLAIRAHAAEKVLIQAIRFVRAQIMRLQPSFVRRLLVGEFVEGPLKQADDVLGDLLTCVSLPETTAQYNGCRLQVDRDDRRLSFGAEEDHRKKLHCRLHVPSPVHHLGRRNSRPSLLLLGCPFPLVGPRHGGETESST